MVKTSSKDCEMSKKIDIKKEIPMKSGKITIGEILEPYGEGSAPVVSIAVSLNGDEPDWKVHIPYDVLDDVIAGLEELKKDKER
jgi:hypothetical protein